MQMHNNPCHQISDRNDTPVCGSDGVTYPSICHFNWYKRFCKSNNEIERGFSSIDFMKHNKDGAVNGLDEYIRNLTLVRFAEC